MKAFKDPEVLKSYINRIYQAVLEPEKFASIMSDLRQVIDAPYSAFQVENIYTNELRQASLFGYDNQSIDSYTEYFVTRDPWMLEALKNNLVDTPFMASHKALKDAAYRESEFYRDWGRHHGVRHSIGTGLSLDDGFIFKANFQRHSDQEAFDEDVELFLNWLRPHLEHFVKLSTVFRQISPSKDYWKQTLLQAGRPIWVVNEKLRLVTYNESAHDWLASGTYLTSKDGHLVTNNHRQQETLINKVRNIIGLTSGNSLHKVDDSPYQFDELRLGDMLNPETFWVSAIMNEEARSEGLVMIVGRKPLPSIKTIMNNHQLTQRQAQVCSLLMKGLSPQLASQELNISINTFRNTLTTCFRLLKVNNQSELIRLLFS